MESPSATPSPSPQNLSNTAGSGSGAKRKRESDPPCGAEASFNLEDFSITNPVNQKVKDNEIINSIPCEKRDSDPPIPGAKKLKNFCRDPRLFCTDMSRMEPPPVLGPGQNVKGDEPNISRGEDEEPCVKTQYCEDYFSDRGCKNEMCQFSHGDWELNEPLYILPKDAIVFHPICDKIKAGVGVFGPPPFRAYMFPYIDESHIGIIFGKSGELFQWICNLAGVKVTVENNEKVPGFKKIVISGSLRKTIVAATLVQALLDNFVHFSEREKIPPMLDFKTQVCKNYIEGCCKHDAEKCCFAHGDSELRQSSVQILHSAMKARREGKDYNPTT